MSISALGLYVTLFGCVASLGCNSVRPDVMRYSRFDLRSRASSKSERLPLRLELIPRWA